MKKHQVTIKDLAKQLGISPSTVSRALKNHPNISQETKSKVRDLAVKLKYEPNRIALSLKNQSSKTIGVIIPEIIHFFFSTIISGIEEIAYSRGYSVMFCQSNESSEKEKLDMMALLSHRVDGMLVSHSRETSNFDHFNEIHARNVPLVFFDRVPKQIEAPKVIIDDFEAGKQATQHLIGKRCKKIAHLAGSLNLEICQNRKEGYLTALRENNYLVEDHLIIDCGKGEQRDGYRCMRDMLKAGNVPDAIFANNDIIALGAMMAIKEAGLRMPEDIAIVGFSNWQFSSLTEPQLSSIAQPGIEMGKVAMQTLFDILDEKIDINADITKVLPSKLVVRASSNKILQEKLHHSVMH